MINEEQQRTYYLSRQKNQYGAPLLRDDQRKIRNFCIRSLNKWLCKKTKQVQCSNGPPALRLTSQKSQK